MKVMKGITCCGDCGYYNWQKHKCSRGCKDEGTAQDHFYKDCPMPDAQLISQWIPCSERLPDNEQEVEITYVNKHWKTGEPLYFTCRAFYTDGTMTTEDSNYVWNDIDNWEYNENFDAYIIPEGWWEGVSFAEEFYPVDKPVIAWMPLPEPYKEGAET